MTAQTHAENSPHENDRQVLITNTEDFQAQTQKREVCISRCLNKTAKWFPPITVHNETDNVNNMMQISNAMQNSSQCYRSNVNRASVCKAQYVMPLKSNVSRDNIIGHQVVSVVSGADNWS